MSSSRDRRRQPGRRNLPIALFGLLLPGACSDTPVEPAAPAPLALEDGCAPLLASTVGPDGGMPGECLLPYPSDFYREPDASTPTGFRVVLHGAAIPRTKAGALADPHQATVYDGASTIPTVVATLRAQVVRDGLPSVLDPAETSASAASPTVLIEADTGAFVSHYVDVPDRRSDGTRTAIVLRPVAALRPNTRYVVAFRRVRLAGEAQALAPVPEGFRRIRDRENDPNEVFTRTAARFETDVFPQLARAGVDRESLQLAWDFTTGSDEAPLRDMLRLRELTLAWLAQTTPKATVTEVLPGKGALWKVVRGTVTGPSFVDGEEPLARLVRDPSGEVALGGTTEIPFVVTIPKSVRDAQTPGRVVGYGHGFFGGLAEVEDGAAGELVDALHAVGFGTPWIGLSSTDLGSLAKTLSTTPGDLAVFTDRIHQAMANWLVLTAAIRTTIASSKELQRPLEGEGSAPAGGAFYDPARVAFFGASLGHILGGTLAALSPDFSRVVLNVGGAGLSHMMPRAAPFGPLSFLLEQAFDDSLMAETFIAFSQRPLDRIDPATYAPRVLGAPLPGSPPDRRILLQVGIGDAGVPTVAALLHARALGIPQTIPSAFPTSGLPGWTPESRGAITLFGFALDLAPMISAAPMPANVIHDGLRRRATVWRQIDAFLSPAGTIVHPCDGACDPD